MKKTKCRCPNTQCQSKSPRIKKDGTFFRKNDSRKIQRFKCLNCHRKFSTATNQLEFKQKKRRINIQIFRLFASGVSQRRAAILLGINYKTSARKFEYVGRKCRLLNKQRRRSIHKHSIKHLQMDDLVTFEHTKLKPLTVTTISNPSSREVLAYEVGTIPASGSLAHKSVQKYGLRFNQHRSTVRNAVAQIESLVAPNALIETDKHTVYQAIIKRRLPKAKHQQYRHKRSCVTGQGELKRLAYDPLFGINHTFAMFRANINRLARKTWCTTKKIERLKMHLDIYICYHNNVLIKKE